jgi:RibD C-terminal domain
MRKIIAALQVSVDGFIEGPNGEVDWAMEEDEETWKDVFEMLESVDTCILGRGMYPEYEQYCACGAGQSLRHSALDRQERYEERNRLCTLGRQYTPCRRFKDPGQGCMENDADHSRCGRNPKAETATGQGHARCRRRHARLQSVKSRLDR